MRSILVVIAVLAIGACNRKADTGAGTATSAASAADTEQLIGIYATSVNLPGAAYGPANLFDGSPTPWATMPGADRMEGVMLYFASKYDLGTGDDRSVSFDALEFTSATDGSMRAVSKLKVFADGVDVGVAEAGTRFSFPQTAGEWGVSSLYLKIEALAPVGGQSTPAPTAIQEVRLFKGGNEVRVLPVTQIRGTVTASSSLAPEEAYSPLFLFDSRRDFGWAEGSPGDGVGESLVFTFPASVTIAGLWIWNGYQRSDRHFTSNARVKGFTFGADGASSGRYTLKDEQGFQHIPLAAPLTGRRFTLRIDEVFPGAAYPDLVISELRFSDGKRVFTIDTNRDLDAGKRALIAGTRGTALEQVLDRTLAGRDGTAMALRSNGSFVVWTHGPGGTVAETVADGNWRILSADASRAQISIFGRVRSLRETQDYYRNRVQAEMVRIFEDNLTVEPGRITGQKLFTRLEYQ